MILISFFQLMKMICPEYNATLLNNKITGQWSHFLAVIDY